MFIHRIVFSTAIFFIIFSISFAATQVTIQPNEATIQNEYYKYKFDTHQGLKLQELFNRYTNDNNIKDPSNLYLGVITLNNERITLDAMNVSDVSKTADGLLTFQLEHPSIQCRVSISYNDTPETVWKLTVKNTSGTDARMKVVFPLISGIIPGASLEQTWFHHGLNGQMIGRQPIILCGASGYSFPVMDIFNKSQGGIYFISHDPDQNLKGYELIKKEPGKTPKVYSESYWDDIQSGQAFQNEFGCGMAAVQGVTTVKNNEEYQTPPTAIGVHPGRWEKAWESYRTWLRSVTKPRSDNNARWWREVYVSKAIHQQHYWKDGKFDWKDVIKPFDRNTYFDINHWMDNRGDYHIRPDQGGSQVWKTELAKLRQSGIHSAFYIEACCVNPLSEIGKAHPEWAVLSQKQRFQEKGEGDPAKPESREYNMCPGSPWKEYLATTAARVLRETNLDAVYLDSMALRFWRCEDEGHGHPAGKGWHHNVGEALHRVDQEVDKVKINTPLYCEFYSSDINSQYMNGSYSPGVAVAQGISSQGFDFCRTGTCLFRFYFPQFKMMEICDYNEKNLGMALFNGNGLHQTFDNPSVQPYMEECARIWEQNVDAFTTNTPEALLETGNEDLFMNKFPAERKTLYTFWNDTKTNWMQKPVTIAPQPNYHYVELFTHREFKPQGSMLAVDVPVDRVAIAAEMPILLKLDKQPSGEITAAYAETLTDPVLAVYAKTGDNWLEKKLPFKKSEIPVNNNTIYDPNKVGGVTAAKSVQINPAELFAGQKISELSVALLDGKKLVDEVPAEIQK